MATYKIISNTKVYSSASVIYRTLTIPATVNQDYTLAITKGSIGTLPNYVSTATNIAQTLSIPYGSEYLISYSGNEGYNGANEQSGTIYYSNTNIAHGDASLIYYNLTVGATTRQNILFSLVLAVLMVE